MDAEQRQQARQLRALARAGVALTSALALDDVLQTLVEVARDVLDARYAALGVLDQTGTGLAQFVFSGLSPEEGARIGDSPRGRGILGIVIREGKTIRVKDVSRDPRAYGFPPNHPLMTSFLGVPIRVHGRVFGNLYVTEKIGGDEFTAEDQEIAELLASQAAVAIENARLYQERNLFTAIMNHEIKNAVSGVLGWSDRLRRLSQDADENLAEAARFTREAAAHLHKLVSDLLELSRIESGRATPDLAATDLRALVREVVGMCRPTAENRQVQIRVEGLDTSATVVTDPQRTRQILLNLVSNAVKFTAPETEVTVRVLNTDSERWAIEVTDRGPGVPPSKRETIFSAYQQADQTHRALGTGLGLTVSRALARILGGDITVDDAPGGGALFTLYLPGPRHL